MLRQRFFDLRAFVQPHQACRERIRERFRACWKCCLPVSTRIAWNRSPMASFISLAATVLSTPPETAPIYRLVSKSTHRLDEEQRHTTWAESPTSFRIRIISFSVKFSISQSARAPQTLRAKLLRISVPRAVCEISGWSWIPVVHSN